MYYVIPHDYRTPFEMATALRDALATDPASVTFTETTFAFSEAIRITRETGFVHCVIECNLIFWPGLQASIQNAN